MGVECDVKERGGIKKNEEIQRLPKKRSKKKKRGRERSETATKIKGRKVASGSVPTRWWTRQKVR